MSEDDEEEFIPYEPRGWKAPSIGLKQRKDSPFTELILAFLVGPPIVYSLWLSDWVDSDSELGGVFCCWFLILGGFMAMLAILGAMLAPSPNS